MKKDAIYQYYCGRCGVETKSRARTDAQECHRCGNNAVFDGKAPRKQQHLRQSSCCMVVTESAKRYKQGCLS